MRKAMFGVAPQTRLPADAYRPEVSERVYRDLAERAGRVVSAGQAALVNAVYDRADHRDLIEETARRAQVPFTGIWLSADADTLKHRVGSRQGGVSDADVAVLESQLRRAGQPANWQHIDVDRPLEEIVADVLATCHEGP